MSGLNDPLFLGYALPDASSPLEFVCEDKSIPEAALCDLKFPKLGIDNILSATGHLQLVRFAWSLRSGQLVIGEYPEALSSQYFRNGIPPCGSSERFSVMFSRYHTRHTFLKVPSATRTPTNDHTRARSISLRQPFEVTVRRFLRGVVVWLRWRPPRTMSRWSLCGTAGIGCIFYGP